MTTISHLKETSATDWVLAVSGVVAPVPHRARLAVMWEAAVNYLVPVGYENETGFHYGEPMTPELVDRS